MLGCLYNDVLSRCILFGATTDTVVHVFTEQFLWLKTFINKFLKRRGEKHFIPRFIVYFNHFNEFDCCNVSRYNNR